MDDGGLGGVVDAAEDTEGALATLGNRAVRPGLPVVVDEGVLVRPAGDREDREPRLGDRGVR